MSEETEKYTVRYEAPVDYGKTPLMRSQNLKSTEYYPTTETRDFEDAMAQCKAVYLAKNERYGYSWMRYRPQSIVEKMTIKGERIVFIQENPNQNKVSDGVREEVVAIANYALMGLYLFGYAFSYDEASDICEQLMTQKNHDYGSAWKRMSEVGIIDEILVKLDRVGHKKNISDDEYAEVFTDVYNYSIFMLMKMNHPDDYCQENLSQGQSFL